RSDRAYYSGVDDREWDYRSGCPVGLRSVCTSTAFVAVAPRPLSPRRQGAVAVAQSSQSGPSWCEETLGRFFLARAIGLNLSRHRVEVGKMWPTRMPLFVDGAVELAPVHPGRGSLQEYSFEDDHLIFGMTDLKVGVVSRNCVAASQPVHQLFVF